MEWLPVAGCDRLLARSRRGFLLIGTLVHRLPARQGDVLRGIGRGRELLPHPDARLPRLSHPGCGRRPPRSRRACAPGDAPSAVPRSRRFAIALAVAVVAFAIVPLGVIAATPRLHDGGRQAVRLGDSLIPVTPIGLAGYNRRTGPCACHGDPPTARGSSVFYRVLRGTCRLEMASPAQAGPATASDDCELLMDERRLRPRRHRSSIIPAPERGSYRIGVAANWLNDPTPRRRLRRQSAGHGDGSLIVIALALLLLEQSEALGEDRVLVGEP